MNIKFCYTDGTTSEVIAVDRKTTAGKWLIVNSTSKKGKTINNISVSYSTGAAHTYVKYAQLEEGINVTENEKYKDPKIYNIYLDEPLRSLGEIRDYIDFRNKKIVRYITEVNNELKKLETPIEEKINLPNILIKEGTNIITVDTEIKPSNFEITYIK